MRRQDERERMIEQSLAAYRVVLHGMGRLRAAEWLRLDLTMAQAKVLLALADEQPACVGAVGERLGIGISAASHLVERLVQLELVDRQEDPENRRRALVRLTLEGQDLISRTLQGGREVVASWLAELDDADLAALCRGLEQLAVVAGRDLKAGTRPT